ncbi:5'-methylthioadenosine/S-adenosylhomocysteine nucleosidase [Pelagicoccus albus]|uniref:5'-methylthioadenosine/S-adenosylhomocysteine nucleosidase n=1 Tax=Pelagicoccus albus TaxID=415222 RepID=A0A7X1B9H8_9BACT|nr:5'-methylthioadenosine/S-adenosylhomocysteine nucleosidase [Pelagicoccus albus]MBC2608138.1 5'-methylthioadenosine/S-adenosylhomocysteine nucleosidase [Pelagicoccus albus]
MPSEVRLINDRLTRKTHGQLECFPYHSGFIGKRKVVVAVTGVGVTNGAMVATLFAHHFKPSELVVSGTGSRFNPRIRTGDTLISKKTIHHAAGSLTDDGMVYRKVRGPLPGQMTHWAYPPDKELFRLAKAAVSSYEPEPVTVEGETYTPKVMPGVVSASDLFGVSDAKIADMKAKLNPDLMEMESAAIAQVCHQLGVPHVVFRAGSNRTQSDPGAAYRKLGQTAAAAAARWTIHFVEFLGNQSSR